MTKKLPVVALALIAAFVVSAAALPQEPKVNVGDRHGNMRAAQELIRQAWQKVDIAQQDNHYNLGGHAGRAKDLLVQASEEIKLSAETANEHH
jgi:Na+(H+)/acetate symporter ActP